MSGEENQFHRLYFRTFQLWKEVFLRKVPIIVLGPKMKLNIIAVLTRLYWQIGKYFEETLLVS